MNPFLHLQVPLSSTPLVLGFLFVSGLYIPMFEDFIVIPQCWFYSERCCCWWKTVPFASWIVVFNWCHWNWMKIPFYLSYWVGCHLLCIILISASDSLGNDTEKKCSVHHFKKLELRSLSGAFERLYSSQNFGKPS